MTRRSPLQAGVSLLVAIGEVSMRYGRRFAELVGVLFERLGIIERERFKATVRLAWPRIVTGFSRMSQQTVDLAMVGLALGPPAVAGLAFAYAYWQIGNRLSVGLSGGSISLFSRHFGADQPEEVDRAIVQSLLVATVLGVPIGVLYFWQAESLIGLMGPAADARYHGATYLSIIAPAILFEFYNKVASRVYAAIGDTITPMVIRAGGAVVNIVLNSVLIFGFDMGTVGAAIGTVIATVFVTVVFGWVLVMRWFPTLGTFPVGLPRSGPLLDTRLLRSLVEISMPLMLQQGARAIVVFPLLSIAAVFGSTMVAAFEISRRIRDLINSLTWGFSIASSSLVGRAIGAGERTAAMAYGREIINLSLITYLALGAVIFAFARTVASFFVTDPATIEHTATFIRIGTVAAVGLGIDGAATGALRGAGDTRWPFYGAVIGLYVFTVPIAYAGLLTPAGVTAIYAAIIVETFVPAAITMYRYSSGAWYPYDPLE